MAVAIFCLVLRAAGAFASNDELRQMAKNYSDTVDAIDEDLDILSAMDAKCTSQTVVYDPDNLSAYPKSVARTFKPAEMAKMDAAVKQVRQEINLGKNKLDQTVERVAAARDSLEKLTATDSLKVANVDACQGGDEAQAKVLATAQSRVDDAKANLSLGADERSKKLPKVSTTIETFKKIVTDRYSQADFQRLIKACSGPENPRVFATMRDGINKLNKLLGYAGGVESSVAKMSTSLSTQSAGLVKQTGCKSIAQGAPAAGGAPAKSQSTITGGQSPAAIAGPQPASITAAAATAPASAAVAATTPSLVDPPLPTEKPASIAAAQRIGSQGSYYTDAPAGVPAATDLSQCYADSCSKSQVRAYQAAINQYIAANNLPITPIATDGIAGTQTANAWRAVMNTYSSGETASPTYTSWGAQTQTRAGGVVYYTFPPAKITNNSQLANFFQ